MQVFIQEIVSAFGLDTFPADTTFVGLIIWFIYLMAAISITLSSLKILLYIAVNARRVV